MRILVTGFEPFGGHLANPSMQAVLALRSRSNLLTRVLPVVYDESARVVRELIDAERPDAVMCLGLCARSPSILLERVAVNVNDHESGDRSKDPPIDPAGPVGYFSTLPLAAMYDALRERGMPVAWSNHAGTYVCNHVFYSARHAIEQRGERTMCGFVHVPQLSEGGLTLPRLVEAVEALIDVIEINPPVIK
jgi:pyroglutamyl-peptidase